MRKLFLLFAMLISLAVSTQAQTSLVATLSHEGTVTTYYSSIGLEQAYQDAVDGDIITLSPGSFTSVSDISKAITIRGAGMELENNPTILNGAISIMDNPEGSGDHNLTLEGLYVQGQLRDNGTINNAVFNKIRVKDFSFAYGHAASAVCMDCILDKLTLSGSSSNPVTASFVNCIISNTGTISPTGAQFNNCVIKVHSTFSDSFLSNCILINSNTYSYTLQSSCTATYCYYQGSGTEFFDNIPYSATNHQVESDVVIFKEGTTYELSDELATTWLGNDGTQVGIYGGMLPFNPEPSNPHITKFDVAPRTTPDGKLSIEIEVKSN